MILRFFFIISRESNFSDFINNCFKKFLDVKNKEKKQNASFTFL